jgi:dipeptidyl aminopeptidase/acylaminoacyl peptidase
MRPNIHSSLLPIALSAFLVAVSTSAAKPTVEDLFRNPEFDNFKISPDGKTLAMLAPFEGYMNLWVYDLEEKEPLVLTGEDLDVTQFHWVNNERLLYTMNQYTFGSDDRRFSGGIFAVNKDGEEHEALVKPIRYRSSTNVIRYLNRYEQDDEYVLVTDNQRRRERPDVFLMNVYNGTTKRLFNNPARINQYYLDECGRIRFGTSADDEFKISQYYRKPDQDEWTVLEKKGEDYMIGTPVYINCDNHLGLVSSNKDRDTRAIFRKNFLTGEVSEEPIIENETYDIQGQPLTAIGGKGIVGLRYEAAKPELVYFDESHKRIQDMIDKALPDTFNEIVSQDLAGSRVIFRAMSDTAPYAYYLLHIDEMRLEPLPRTMHWLDDVELAPTRPISYEARDGRTIHGYLTLPVGWEKGERVPLLVNPHGGPWSRDRWGLRFWYDMERQFYASHGFAVLRVNFRGSTGYGKDHLESSFKDLESMHHDVIDGVRWAIEEGYADKDKLGIGGGSWGGYATMTALVKNPEMFKFGVNFFGVIDIIEQIRTYKEWDRDEAYEYWIRRVGDPSIDEDREHIEEWSAINYLENIEAPVFIYHGVRDFNVDIEQSRTLIRKLKSLGKAHTAVIRTDEAHSAFDEENRIDTYEELDAFLREVTAGW